MRVIKSLQCEIVGPLPDWIEDVGLTAQTHGRALDQYAVFAEVSVTARQVDIDGLIYLHDGYRQVRPETSVMASLVRCDSTDNPRTRKVSLAINLIGLPPKVSIDVIAKGAGREDLVGRILVERQPLEVSYQPRHRLIPLNTQGRSGSTWLMRLLSLHPEISTDPTHPYEFKGAQYFINMLRALTQPCVVPNTATMCLIYRPADHAFPPNPYYSLFSTQQWALDFLGGGLPHSLARFALESIDQLYDSLDSSEDDRGVSGFGAALARRIKRGLKSSRRRVIIEKQTVFPALVNELYGHTKQVFLFRDPRDILCSIHAFYEKTGVSIIGTPAVYSDPEFVGGIMMGFRFLWKCYNGQRGVAHRIDYGDLMAAPETELRSLLRYLEIDSSPPTIAHILEQGVRDTTSSKAHRTSGGGSASVARWHRDLPEDVQRLCWDIAGEDLDAAGFGH